MAPWIYLGVNHVADQFGVLHGLAKSPFHRYVTRSWMVAGILGLWPLMRLLHVKPADLWAKYGSGRGIRLLGAGLSLGFGSLALAVLVTVVIGPRSLNTGHESGEWLKHLINAGLAALVVGIIEEVFFRGVVFGGLRKGMPWGYALILSSSAYALLHFFERSVHEGPVIWSSGIALLPRMLRGLGDWHSIIPGFLNLLVAGSLLALAYQKLRDLRYSIGLHAGWIFWGKSYAFLTTAPQGISTWFWGSAKLIDGWLALPLLLMLVPFVVRLRTPESSNSGTISHE